MQKANSCSSGAVATGQRAWKSKTSSNVGGGVGRVDVDRAAATEGGLL